MSESVHSASAESATNVHAPNRAPLVEADSAEPVEAASWESLDSAQVQRAGEAGQSPASVSAAQRQMLLQMNARFGNAHMSRRIERLLQRQPGPAPAPAPGPAPAAPVPAAAAPGLTDVVYAQVDGLIRGRKRRQALNALVTYLVGAGHIDATLLRGGRMVYSAGTPGEGETIPAGFRRDPVTGVQRSRPTVVRIGPGAFRGGVTLLYTTVMHEYQHVLQMQENVAVGIRGQRSLGWLIHRQEVDAYAWEIINGADTGLLNNRRLLRDTWNRLHNEHWLQLGRRSRNLPELKDKYKRAYEIASRALGPRVHLPVDARAIR